MFHQVVPRLEASQVVDHQMKVARDCTYHSYLEEHLKCKAERYCVDIERQVCKMTSSSGGDNNDVFRESYKIFLLIYL